MTEIQIEHVTKKIKGAVVVDQVSLNLHSGQVVGLSGVNGSGKTMLMRLTAGLLIPTEGRIVINGKILGKDMEFPESIGILIENPAFLDSYSGFQNLKLLASIQNRIEDSDIRETLTRVGLSPDDRKKYKKYSLGMKQRLGIAGAILEKPDITILDEPTNALDQSGIEILKQIVREEKARGALVLLSCHDKSVLEEMADEIHHMENGKMVETIKGRAATA